MRIIKPRERKAGRLPRWTLVAIVVALVASFVAGLAGLGVAHVLWVPGLAGAFVLALWLEDRVYAPFAHAPLPKRLTVLIALLAGGVVASFVASALVTPTMIALGFSGAGPLLVHLFVVWFVAAALGGLPVFLAHAFASTLFPTFRRRIQIVVLLLVAMAVLCTVIIAVIGINLVDALKHDDPHWLAGEMVAGLVPRRYFTNDVLPWIDTPAAIVVVAAIVATIYGLPALISATAKLAETLMERVMPLVDAFDDVASGARDLQIEEGGSVEIKRTIQRFNAMVSSLALAERMERAFGQYVSGHVLQLIRARHGDGALPASLREASVFFADIRGFTSMSEKLSPDQVVAVLNRYFERVVKIIHDHDGYLNKFIGDAVVVVFNGPIDQPDHAERATKCAIAIQQCVDEMNAACSFPELTESGGLKIGVGVSTGPMVCGNIGGSRQMEYTVIGDTVNLSARLTSKAGAGEVWISELTAKQLPSSQKVEALEPISVKGKEQAVKPFKAWPL